MIFLAGGAELGNHLCMKATLSELHCFTSSPKQAGQLIVSEVQHMAAGWPERPE